jgi:hypothetical protein
MEIKMEAFGHVGSRESICPVPVEYKFKGKAKLVFGLPSLSLIFAFALSTTVSLDLFHGNVSELASFGTSAMRCCSDEFRPSY